METAGGKLDSASFQFPTTFCKPKLTRLRLRNYHSGDGDGEWEEREREWTEFWRTRGRKEKLDNKRRGFVNGMHDFLHRNFYLLLSHACFLEAVWVDFILKNPLQVEVELTDLTVVVKEAGKTITNEPQEGLAEVEEIDKVSLAPGEQRTVSTFLCVISSR